MSEATVIQLHVSTEPCQVPLQRAQFVGSLVGKAGWHLHQRLRKSHSHHSARPRCPLFQAAVLQLDGGEQMENCKLHYLSGWPMSPPREDEGDVCKRLRAAGAASVKIKKEREVVGVWVPPALLILSQSRVLDEQRLSKL